MFWIEEIAHGQKFCVCGRQWKSLKIVYFKTFWDTLEVFLTPETGKKTTFLRLRNGEVISSSMIREISKLEWQHMKIEVWGGDIVIMGETTISATGKPPVSAGQFLPDCPFAEEEDWELIEKNVNKIIPNGAESALEALPLIKEDDDEMLKKRFMDGISYIKKIEPIYKKNNDKKALHILRKVKETLEFYRDDLTKDKLKNNKDKKLLYFNLAILVESIKTLHAKEYFEAI